MSTMISDDFHTWLKEEEPKEWSNESHQKFKKDNNNDHKDLSYLMANRPGGILCSIPKL